MWDYAFDPMFGRQKVSQKDELSPVKMANRVPGMERHRNFSLVKRGREEEEEAI